MKKTLLEQAKKFKSYRRIRKMSDEELELTLAWLEDEISYGQIAKVLGLKGSNVYNFVATGLRYLVRRGTIKLIKK